MWNDSLVIDGVTHIYDATPGNRGDNCPPGIYGQFGAFLHRFFHQSLESRRPGYELSFEEFNSPWAPEELAEVCFGESCTDVMAFHSVDLAGLFKVGLSPYWIGQSLKRSMPDRVLLYAPVDPLEGRAATDRMARHAAEDAVDGFKVYPSNGVIDPQTGQMASASLADPKVAFPVFEKALDLGIRNIAVHKAIPLGMTPLDLSRIDDIAIAAAAFPELNFQIVHAGWAFLDDTVTILQSHPNVYVNLECTANFLNRRPETFAHILGRLVLAAGPNRIVLGTGAFVTHPRPVIDGMIDFQMPTELQEGYGYADVTPAMKAKFLGKNLARLHGIDPAHRLRELSTDSWSQRRAAAGAEAPAAKPWGSRRAALLAGAR